MILDNDDSSKNDNFLCFFPAFGGDTKGDLIAELKLSHTIGGVSKLRSEQVISLLKKMTIFTF